MKKIFTALLMVTIMTALCLSLSACGSGEETSYDGDWDKVQQSGELVIGYVEDPPFFTMQDGELTGFDYKYSNAVCEYLGIEPVYESIAWESKDKLLAKGKVDVIWDCLTITDERKEIMDFSDAYLKTGQAIAIRKADKEKYSHISNVIKDFSTFALEADSAQYEFVMSSGQTDEDSIRTYATIDDILKAVSLNYADAAASDQIILQSRVGDGTDYPDLILIQGLNIPVSEIAVGMRKGSDLAAHINEATDALFADGTMDKIAEEYNLTDLLIKR